MGGKGEPYLKEKRNKKTTVKKTRHIAKNKLNFAKKVNTHVDQCLLKVRAKNLLGVNRNEEVIAI